MNKQAISIIWAATIQLFIAAFIVVMVYVAATEVVDADTYELDIQTSDAAFLVESLATRDIGITQLHTFSTQTFTTVLNTDYVRMSTIDGQAGQQEVLATPESFVINEYELVARGNRWTRSGSAITLSQLQVQQECPSAQTDWQSIAIVGQQPAVQYVQTAIQATTQANISTYERLSQQRNEDLLIRITTNNPEAVLYSGAGEANERIRCVVANKLDENGIMVTVQASVSQQEQLQLLLTEQTSLTDLQTALREAFEELQ